jgi:hypothetical protein
MHTTVTHTILLVPGTKAEADATTEATDSSVQGNARAAEPGGGWTWQVTVPPGRAGRLSFQAEGAPTLKLLTTDGQPLDHHLEQAGNDFALAFTVPANHPRGAKLSITFQAAQQPIAVRHFNLAVELPDSNADGVADWVAGLMGLASHDTLDVTPRPREPHTSFFYSTRYDPALAIPTDAVRLYYNGMGEDPILFRDYAAKGYSAQTMLHSRFRGGLEVGPGTPDAQRDRAGQSLGVHVAQRNGQALDLSVPYVTPEWRADVARRFGADFEVMCADYYRVPTRERDRYASGHYADALAAGGATGFGFDEPEFWTYAGYCEAFQQEWQDHYGTPWQPPHSSIDARYRADRLKGTLFARHVQAVLQDVQQRKPSVTRLLAAHSPVNYYILNIVCDHSKLIALPELQEVIAEVWTGTERVPVPLAGDVAERTFEVGMLEYSSFYHLVRGTDKRLWFLHDPLEDRPNLPMEFYHRNYVRTVVASLMFPAVDNYEVLVWPNRIYGCTTPEYESLVNAVVGALCELWRYPDYELDAGSPGVGTFIADSMAWQRDDPAPADYSDFWGLTLPLLSKGVPVQVLSLDRAAEPGYLDDFKVLLLCYDFLKPATAQINQALVEWVRAGGTLIYTGGTDAYNALQDSWWRAAGYASPGEDLLARLGAPGHGRVVSAEPQALVLTAASDAITPGTITIPEGRPAVNAHREGGSIVLLPEQPEGPCLLTLMEPPAGAQPLYRLEGESIPAVWEMQAGKGALICAGVTPRFMANTPQGDAWLSALVRRAYEKSGGAYKEQSHLRIRRGPYSAISALDQPCTAKGRYVDLFSTTLDVVEDPIIPAHQCAFLVDAPAGGETPHILAVSGRLRACSETADATVLLSQSPSGTQGLARIQSGARQVKRVSACSVMGDELSSSHVAGGQTILVRFANHADGAVVRVEWEA